VTETIGDIGELALIERLKPFCAVDAIGDDAALMSVRSGHQLVVTTDVLVEGVHFSDRTTPPYSVGWRSAAANLSDLAAMGAEPMGITVGLGLPKQTPWSWVEGLYTGLSDCLCAHDAAIYGGDLCRASQLVVSITALGEVAPQRLIRRDAAAEGMTVVVTGAHGGSRAGLAVLLQEIEGDINYAQDWVRAHQMPVPRFDAIAQLRSLIGTSPMPAIAGMDSSDGLANALLQLCHSSGVGIEVFQNAIPLPEGLSNTVGVETAFDWALYGGEDFELVLCLPDDLANRLVGTGIVSAIGQTTSVHSGEVHLIRLNNTREPITHKSFTHKSFQHF